MAKKTFHNILCPGCFSEIKPNNVVFALSKGPKYHDKYTRAQITNNATRVIREYFDPILFNGTKTYSEDGVLMKIENTEQGICADVRLCPYCHYEIPYSFIGNKKIHIVSVLGCSGSGKSVYERALIYNLRRNGFTMSVKNDNREIDNLNSADFPDPQEVLENSGISSALAATTEIRGPYIYNVQNDDDDFLLVLYDLPGEYFGSTQEITDKHVSSILKKSDLVVFIIDPTNKESLKQSRIALENYLNFSETESLNIKNLTILVNKVDSIKDKNIYKTFETFSRPHKVPDEDSKDVRQLVDSLFFIPRLPEDTKFFTSQLFEHNKAENKWVWNPQRYEEPFLWWRLTLKSADEKKGKK